MEDVIIYVNYVFLFNTMIVLIPEGTILSNYIHIYIYIYIHS